MRKELYNEENNESKAHESEGWARKMAKEREKRPKDERAINTKG